VRSREHFHQGNIHSSFILFSSELLFGVLEKKTLVLALRYWANLAVSVKRLGKGLLRISVAIKLVTPLGIQRSRSDHCSMSLVIGVLAADQGEAWRQASRRVRRM
jgi:hypothetical protein